MDDLKLALTVLQPWADAITYGAKRIENRDWCRKDVIGKRIWIHAGKRWDDDGALTCVGLWPEMTRRPPPAMGAIIGFAMVIGFLESPSIVPASFNLSDNDLRWYNHEAIGWVLEDAEALSVPIPARGALGLWYVPDEVRALAMNTAVHRG